jgi:uncharacterized alkaline shock family protein YloU
MNREVGKQISEILDNPIVGLVLGVALLLSVLFRWVNHPGAKKSEFISFNSSAGSVDISVKAVRDFIARIGKEFSAVKNLESRIFQKKEEVDILLRVKVYAGNKIPELSELLQARVRESVRDSLGIENIRNVTVRVDEIVGESSSAPSYTPPKAESAEELKKEEEEQEE